MVVSGFSHVLELNEQGVALLMQEKNNEAVGAFTLCIQLLESFLPPLYNRAVALNKLGRYEEALVDARLFIKLTNEAQNQQNMSQNQVPQGYNLAADILLNMKNYGEADRYYTMAIEACPLPVIFYRRGLTRCLMGDFGLGYEDVREAAEMGYPEAREIMERIATPKNEQQQTAAACQA